MENTSNDVQEESEGQDDVDDDEVTEIDAPSDTEHVQEAKTKQPKTKQPKKKSPNKKKPKKKKAKNNKGKKKRY